MYSKRFILLAVLVSTAAFSAKAQKTDDWTIGDYLKNLPEAYKTFRGDFLPPSKDSTIIDEANGYTAYLNSPRVATGLDNLPFPIFEMALFKSQTRTPLLVASNLKSDAVCDDYETFFLRHGANGWAEVEREVLPPINLKMFWDKQQASARFLKIVDRDNPTSYHFEPPRRGIRMKVSLKICDYFLETAPMKNVEELRKLIETTKPIYLNWDKHGGKFNVAK